MAEQLNRRNTNYQMEVMVRANTRQAQQDIQNLADEYKTQRTIAVNVVTRNGAQVIRELNTITNAMGDVVRYEKLINGLGAVVSERVLSVAQSVRTVETNTRKWQTATGRMITQVETLNSKGERVRDTIREWTDATGANHKETQKYVQQVNGYWRPLGEAIHEVTQDTVALRQAQENLARANADVTTSITAEQKTLQRNGQTVQAVVTTTTKATTGFGAIREEVTKYTNAQGVATEEVRRFEQQADGTFAQVGGTMTRNVQDFTQQIDESGKKVRTFGDILKTSFQKMISFYISSLPLRAFQQAVSETITTVKEFDEAITEMGKVSSLSGKELQNYAKTLGDIGAEVARTRTEMVQSTTELLKSGYSEEDAANLAKVVALYQNTADEELSAADATSVLISQMKAYKEEFKTVESAIQITDAINRVSADFAVSSGDIGRGLTAAGAALSTYGNKFNDTIAMLTAGEHFLPVTD